MALLFFLVEWAERFGKLPSEVYDQYIHHPKDFQMLWTFRNFRIEKENKAQKEANKPLGGKGKKPF